MRGRESRKTNSSPGLRIEDLNAKTISKQCRRDSHGSSESWVRRCPWRRVSVRGGVRNARSMAPCVARRSNVAVCGLCGAIDRSVRGAIAVSDRSNVALRGLCGDFCQNSSEPRCGRSLRHRVFDPRFVSCWPMFADLSVVKRRCALCLLKLRSRLRETRNRIQKIDPSRTICSIVFF